MFKNVIKSVLYSFTVKYSLNLRVHLTKVDEPLNITFYFGDFFSKYVLTEFEGKLFNNEAYYSDVKKTNRTASYSFPAYAKFNGTL